MTQPSFVPIRTFRDALEADEFVKRLAAEGIDATVIPNFFGSGPSFGNTATCFEVYVPIDATEAVRIVSAAEQGRQDQDSTDRPQDGATKFLLGVARFFGPAPLLGVAYAVFINDLDKALIMLLLTFLAAMVGLLAFGLAQLRGRSQRRAQRKRQAIASAIADLLVRDEPTPPFMAFLRPFRADGRLIHVALESTPTFTGGDGKRSVRLDLEQLLAFAAGDLGHPLLALGRPGERFGSGYISTNDNDWKALATRLVQRASLVLVGPGLSPGTRWELDLLRQIDCWRKVVFIMPPMGNGYDWAAQWAEISARLAQVGLTLPPYHDKGALFTVARPGEIGDLKALPSNWTIGTARTLLQERLHSDARTAVV